MGLARAMDRIISMRDGSIEHDSATSLTEAST
jgi:hypothetical protein